MSTNIASSIRDVCMFDITIQISYLKDEYVYRSICAALLALPENPVLVDMVYMR